jgi:hypothetical protein
MMVPEEMTTAAMSVTNRISTCSQKAGWMCVFQSFLFGFGQLDEDYDKSNSIESGIQPKGTMRPESLQQRGKSE